ncbi:hypothetical protein QZH41_001726, partial [Actinostola sp. cb2023]
MHNTEALKATIEENSSDAADPAKMMKLFEVTRTCMRKHAGSGGDDFMREIQRLSNKNRIMEQDLNDKDQALFEEKNKADKLSNRVEEVERETRNLKRERETLALRREGDSAKTTVAKKNKELSEYLDEIKILQEENETLGDQLINVKKELEESAMEMNKMTDEYTKLKVMMVLEATVATMMAMMMMTTVMTAIMVQDLRVQVSSKSDADDQIMMAVNLKVEEWKHIMASKDVEIAQHRAVIAELKQRITGLEMDSDKTSLVMLQQGEYGLSEAVQEIKDIKAQIRIRDQAVELGITAEDLADVEDEPERFVFRKKVIEDSDTEEARTRNKRLQNDIEKSENESEKVKSDLKKIEVENDELKDENKQLEIGLREILAQLRENSSQQAAVPVDQEKESTPQAVSIQVPALEKLMAMIESRNAVGQYDTNLQLKAQIEQLTGGNAELRHELQNARNETSKSLIQVEHRQAKGILYSDYTEEKKKWEEDIKIKTDEKKAIELAREQDIGRLKEFEEMATYKIHALQQALDDSVSSKELENANKQYNELTAKYRDLLQRENTLVSRTVLVENLETDVKALQEREAELKKDMTSLKERNHSLEQMLNELFAKDGKSVGDSSPARQEEINRISRKLATLEMKELNERERAEHSTRKYEQLKKVFDELEIRNADLEHKFSEIGMLNLEAQRIERHLREELEGAVTKNMHQSVVKRLQSSEETESKLKVEVSRLKEVAEVAAHQTEAVRGNQESQDKELMALRKQLYDVQMESDDKTIIGKLHHHIVALQVSEGMAVRKLESAIQKVSKLEAQILRLEQKIDEKDQTLYHTKMENRNKEKFLKRTIQELRRQYSGSLPLMKQERFANTMRSLQEDKVKLEQEVNQAKARRESAEDKLAELQLKQSSLEELIATLKDHKGAVKVTEWHSKLNEIRLQDLKLNRTLDRVKQQNKHLENVIRSHERVISDYEEEIVQLSKHHEERQLLWEQREVELERTVDRLEKQQKDMLDAATRFEEATGAIPDPNLPVANQLELAVRKIREHIKVIIGTKHENKNLNKIINELRLRLPVSERDAITRAASKSAEKDDYEARQALKVTQATVSSLQQMLARKEQSLGKYQEMLKDARDEAKKQADQHKLEIKLLQDRLHLESDEVFKRMKLSHQESINAPGPLIPTEDQLARLGELEETVAEQDNALAIAAEKFKRSREENLKLRKEHVDQVNTMKKDYERKSTIYEKQIKELRDEIQIKDDKYMVKRKEELSKRDSALIKLGAELKDLESVEDRLEQKEEQIAEEKRKVVRVQSDAEKLRKKVKSLEDQLGVERAEGDIVVVDTQDVEEAAPPTLDFPPEPK